MLRRRIPFSFADDAGEDDLRILDEQEQDDLIHRLKSRTTATNAQYTLAARLLVSLSTILHLINAWNHSPSMFLVLLTFLIHLNLFLYLLPSHIRMGGNEVQLPFPLSFGRTYALSAVAPTWCLSIGYTWKAMSWWLITPAMVYIVHSVKIVINEANNGISELESLKYCAPGA